MFESHRMGYLSMAKILVLCASSVTAYGQYNSGQQYGMAKSYSGYGGSVGYGHSQSYSGYGDGDSHGGVSESEDSRPKINLGFRLKIPAFKFELPKFNLPKITVSAKIRQPNRPRTITLPEINLDTSSGEHPQKNHGNSYYSEGNYVNKNTYSLPSASSGYSSDYQANKVGHRENLFTFSTHEGATPQQHHSYGYGAGAVDVSGSNNYGAGTASSTAINFNTNQASYHQAVGTGYSSTNVHPTYLNSKFAASAPSSLSAISSPSYNSQYLTSQQLSDVGFNAPVYDEPINDHSAYLFRPLSANKG